LNVTVFFLNRLERHAFEPFQLAQWTRVAACLLVDVELHDSSLATAGFVLSRYNGKDDESA